MTFKFIVDDIQIDQIERFKAFVSSTLEEVQYGALSDASICQAIIQAETQANMQVENEIEVQADMAPCRGFQQAFQLF